MYLIQRIEDISIKIGDSRKNVAEFILAQQKNIFNFTIDEIAEKCFTSKSTVTRFAKLLGYRGWRDFMKAFLMEIKYHEKYRGSVDVNYPFAADSSDEEIAKSLARLQTDSINETLDILDMNMLGRAVNYIIRAKKIVVLAASPNCFIADSFIRKMNMIGYNINPVQKDDIGISLHDMNKDDCVIMISYAGHNRESNPMKYIANLKRKKVPIIAITSEGDNYLRQNSNAALTISSRERLYSKIAGFASEQSISFILNILYSCVYSRNYDRNTEYKTNLSYEIEKERISVLKEQQEE